MRVPHVIIYGFTQHYGLSNVTNDGATTLYTASEEGQLDVVQCLAKAGVDLNQAKENGATPLTVARAKDHSKVVVFLKRAGTKE